MIAADFEAIAEPDDGDFRVASRDLADLHWVIAFTSPHRPIRYFLWDRAEKESTFLFSHRPELDTFELAQMRPIKYRACDGLEVHGYLTLPPGVEARNLPLVLHPHGAVVSRLLDLRCLDAAARESRLCSASAQLSRVDRLRQKAS